MRKQTLHVAMLVVVVGGSVVLAACGDDDTKDTALARAADDACARVVFCERENGAPIDDHDEFCAQYSFSRVPARADRACVDRTIAYLECVASADCSNFDDACDPQEDAAEDACEVEDDESNVPSDRSITEATNKVCERALNCLPEGTGLTEAQVCGAYRNYEQAALMLSTACRVATVRYLNCEASTPCSSDGSECEALVTAVTDACVPRTN